MTNHVIWITASAGTGKTTALINRYKALLETCRPEQIIGITFTINAANEIKERLTHQEGGVAVFPDVTDSCPQDVESVRTGIQKKDTGSRMPNKAKAAPSFAKLREDSSVTCIDTFRIQTIHSLCHQLLSNHTGKSINILDPNEKKLLIDQALRMALNEQTELTKRLAQRFSFYHLQSLMEKIAAHLPDRQQNLKDKPRDFDFTDVPAVFEPIRPNSEIMKMFKDVMDPRLREDDAGDVSMFLTKTGEVRKRILDAATAKKHPELALMMQDEAHRLYALMQERAAQEWLYDNNLMHQLADRVWDHYQTLKRDRLDYDELIHATKIMLEDDVARYDICRQIHHVLLDEAQDTNPKQWRIIELLTQHLFDDPTTNKSFFVVGDHKQAIYGFQNASPEFMQQQKQKYKGMVGQGFVEESLEVNYRSVGTVCDYVETQCASPGVQVAREHEGFVLEVTDFDDALAKFLNDPPFLPSQNRPLELRDIMILCRKRDKTYRGIIEKYGDQIRFEQTQLLSDLPDIQKLMYQALLLAEPDNAYAAYKVAGTSTLSSSARAQLAIEDPLTISQSGCSKIRHENPIVLKEMGPRSAVSFGHLAEDDRSVLRLITTTLSHNSPLLDIVLSFVAQHTITTFQSLYWWLRAYPYTLKTISTDNPNTMRLLTMHGAKGLQAPVVFVFNDWTDYNQQDIWWDYNTMDFVIPPTKSVHHPTLTAIRQQNRTKQTAEDARLRYVAFTRAMDVLVVVANSDV